KGQPIGLAGPKDNYEGQIELSPQDHFVAFHRTGRDNSISILDIERNAVEVFGENMRFPRWAPDERAIAYSSARNSVPNLYSRPFRAAGEETPLLKTESPTNLDDWSPKDGRFLVYESERDIWALPLSGSDRNPIRITNTTARERDTRVSPDGRWIAYVSE